MMQKKDLFDVESYQRGYKEGFTKAFEQPQLIYWNMLKV